MSQKLVEPKHKMKTQSGFRDFSVCKNQRIILTVIYDTVRIYDINYQSPTHIIKLDTTPHGAKLSQCGKYFYIHDSNNMIYLYDTRSGLIIQQISGIPTLSKTVKFSKNSEKLIYGSTQMLCLWNIRKCAVDVRTQHWKNMSCYDVNRDGTQFAIGTYNGVIYVLDFIEVGRCSQIQITRHKTCVASICCHNDQVISASYDGYFLISTISKDRNDERIITYHEMKMKSIPKQMQSIGNYFYMFNNQGMTWFNRAHGLTLTGFTDYKTYRPLVNQQGNIIFVSLNNDELQWWPAHVFKTAAQIQKAKKQKEKQKHLVESLKQKSQEQSNRNCNTSNLTGKENRIFYRVSYR